MNFQITFYFVDITLCAVPHTILFPGNMMCITVDLHCAFHLFFSISQFVGLKLCLRVRIVIIYFINTVIHYLHVKRGELGKYNILKTITRYLYTLRC